MLLINVDALIAASRLAKNDREHVDDEEPALVEDASHLPQLVALGAEYEEARALLDIHGNRLDRAVEEFLQRNQQAATANTTQGAVDDLLERARGAVEGRGTTTVEHCDVDLFTL